MTEEIQQPTQLTKEKVTVPSLGTDDVVNKVREILAKTSEVVSANFKKFFGGGLNFGSRQVLGLLKNIAIVFVVFVVIAFVVSRIVNLFNGNNGKGGTQDSEPTVPVYQSQKPSIYAEDEEILGIEEKVKVLDKEMSDTVVRETILNPPPLDFDVDFRIKE